MMPRPRANEIPKLIRQLASRNRPRVDSARARLLIIGERAVEDLIEALEGNDSRLRARVMPLLALLRDPRGREPLLAMLLDRNARMRRIAARCLARFPTADVVAALDRIAIKDTHDAVRIAAVHSLVEQYTAGHERALRVALDRLLDTTESTAVRAAAFALLRSLRPAHRRSLLARLGKGSDAELRRLAGELAAEPTAAVVNEAGIRGLLDDLGAEDYAVWNRAVVRLGASGRPVVGPLIGEMRRRARDAEYCARAGMALKGLGPRMGAMVADAVETVDDPLPLRVLVDVIGAIGEKSVIYRLKDLIDRLGRERASGGGHASHANRRVRARAHLELARIGSRVAIVDLREALAEPDGPLELEIVGAVARVGKRDEVALLLRAWANEDRFVRERVAGAVRSILERERIQGSDPYFESLEPAQRAALTAILGSSRPARRGRRAARKRGSAADNVL